MMRVLVNGQEGAAVDPLDRGLQYGDGLFETIAVVAGRPRFLDWHLERLVDGARAPRFPGAGCRRCCAREIAAVATGRAVS